MQAINLNGTWDFVVDLDPKYHNDERFGQPEYSHPGWDRRHWLKVPVPGVWNKYEERLDIYEGVCWFVREFVVDSYPEGAEAILRFGAVNYSCRIYLNDRYVGSHEGGYTEFTIDVSKAIKAGDNHLAIEVDNRAALMKLPPVLGYFNYGGIHRDVTLEIYPDPRLKDVFFDASPTSGGGELCVAGCVERLRKGLRIRLVCNDADKVVDWAEKGTFKIDLTVPGVKPWSPDSPTLHKASLQLLDGDNVIHEVSYDVGFRSIEIQKGKILLNGEPVFLRGICYVYDSPDYGLVFKPDQFLADIALFKEMRINAIRSHSPFPREFYEACDRAGIMIWIEPPIYCIHPADKATGTAFSDPAFQALADSMAREMVVHARSHPSVVIYSVGNECNVENPEAESFFRRLSEVVRSLDDTRLLSYASLYCNVGPLAEMVDILGINEYWGWYDKLPGYEAAVSMHQASKKRCDADNEPIDLQILDEKLEELKRLHHKPMLLTEFGADSIPGNFSQSRELWSEDYHADLIQETFAVLREHPEICGTFPFCFSDYRDPSKHTNACWNGMNHKGMVSYERQPKKAFHALKKVYKQL